MSPLKQFLFKPIPASSLAFFRVVFGILAAAELINNTFYRPRHHILQSDFQFQYYGFEWMKPLPLYWMEAFYLFLALCAIGIALGWRYRILSIVFALGYPFTYFMEKSSYLNHDYLFLMLAFVMACLPAANVFSLDSRKEPEKYSKDIPQWTVAVLCFLMGLVYFYGGIAKLQEDWLMAKPLKIWLGYKKNYWLIGPLLELEATAYFMAWNGMLLDLFGAFLLLSKRTRKYMLAAILFFHLTNTAVFKIGIFPWLSISLSALFFPPEIFEKFHEKYLKADFSLRPDYIYPSIKKQQLVIWSLAILITYQLLMPLRQHLYPSDPTWSEEAHRFSWRMMLRSKVGSLHYVLVNPETKERKRVFPHNLLLPKQTRVVKTHPEMILQFAHYLGEKTLKEEGYLPEIYAQSKVKLNGRPFFMMVDSARNLMEIENKIWPPADWILPHPDIQAKQQEELKK